MELRILGSEDLEGKSEATLLGMPGDDHVVAEALRRELAARRVSSRRGLCDRVGELLAPLAAVPLDRIKEILSELERAGDVTTGPGGTVAAAPLRVVDLGGGRYRAHGTVPTRDLVNSLGKEFRSRGVCRTFVAEDADADSIRSAVTESGGVVLSPERWAGLDRVPKVDGTWLEELGARSDGESVEAGVLDAGLSDAWRTYRPQEVEDPRRSRWKKPAGGADERLWRARHERGYWVYAWTDGGEPSTTRAIRLLPDEAHRTTYALHRDAGRFLRFGAREEANEVVLELAGFLPRAEYRYLDTVGEIESGPNGERSVRVPRDAWNTVRETLVERLGVEIVTGGD